MAKKFLDEDGLSHLWQKIKSKFTVLETKLEQLDKKADLVDGKVPMEQLPDNIGDSGGSDTFTVDATIDLATVNVSSISHTYNEVLELLESGKLGFFRVDFGQGDAYGHITSYNAAESLIYYQVMATFNFGDGTKLYFFCIIQGSDNNPSLVVHLVPTTGIGG